MSTHIRPAISLLLFMTLLTGLAYPLSVTAIAQLAFPVQANGSLLQSEDGRILGSELIAQPFDGAQWFQPRPSAGDHATVASAASNLAQSNPALLERVTADSQRLVGEGSGPVPMQLVTTSGSGLDPHLSPEAANWQAERIAKARGMTTADLQRLIEAHTERPLVGPAVVNVLALNLALADNRERN